MHTYTLVALPEKNQLSTMNNLKNYLYINGFRHTLKPNNSDTHITLAQATLTDNEVKDLKVL